MPSNVKRTRRRTPWSTKLIKKVAEDLRLLSEHNVLQGQLLSSLAVSVARNTRSEQRFRYAVLMGLARIETTLELVLSGQMMQFEAQQIDFWRPEKLAKDMEAAEKHVAARSEKIARVMMQHVYDSSAFEKEIKPASRKRKRSA